MGKKKAGKAGTTSRKATKATRAKARPEKNGRRGAAPDEDAELLAQLLLLQERTAAVGRQLRAIGELVSTATVGAAGVIEMLGGVADSESAEPPPVAARPRRRRPSGG